jgi:hypothetical protein
MWTYIKYVKKYINNITIRFHLCFFPHYSAGDEKKIKLPILYIILPSYYSFKTTHFFFKNNIITINIYLKKIKCLLLLYPSAKSQFMLLPYFLTVNFYYYYIIVYYIFFYNPNNKCVICGMRWYVAYRLFKRTSV